MCDMYVFFDAYGPCIILFECFLLCYVFLFQVCYARVLDYRRKFIEATQRYNELSYKSIVHETERLEALKHALHCTILASAGKTAIRDVSVTLKLHV